MKKFPILEQLIEKYKNKNYEDEEYGEGIVFDPLRYDPYDPGKDYSAFLPEWAEVLSAEEQRAVAWLASQLPTYYHDVFSPHYSDDPFNRKMIVRHAVEVFDAVKEAYQSR